MSATEVCAAGRAHHRRAACRRPGAGLQRRRPPPRPPPARLSADAVAARVAMLRDASGALSGVDTDDLDVAERVDHEQLLSLVERNLFAADRGARARVEPVGAQPGRAPARAGGPAVRAGRRSGWRRSPPGWPRSPTLSTRPGPSCATVPGSTWRPPPVSSAALRRSSRTRCPACCARRRRCGPLWSPSRSTRWPRWSLRGLARATGRGRGARPRPPAGPAAVGGASSGTPWTPS